MNLLSVLWHWNRASFLFARVCVCAYFSLFGRYNISSNHVNSYLNIMRFNWCIMVFILLLVKANKMLVRLNSMPFVLFIVSMSFHRSLSLSFLCINGRGETCFRIVKREPHLVKKNYGNFIKWNKNKCKRAQPYERECERKRAEGIVQDTRTATTTPKKGRHIKYIDTHKNTHNEQSNPITLQLWTSST